MTDIAFHEVKEIRISPTQETITKRYYKSILIKTKDGQETVINLFGNTFNDLIFFKEAE